MSTESMEGGKVEVECCRKCRFPTESGKRVVWPLDNAARTVHYYHHECLPDTDIDEILCDVCGYRYSSRSHDDCHWGESL